MGIMQKRMIEMNAEKLQLLEYAVMLSQLGEEIEKAWRYIVQLREMGARANTNVMWIALRDYREAENLFQATRTQYFAQRDKLEAEG